jgi:hypothetical protein
MAAGTAGFRRGDLWYTGRDAGYGAPITMPTLGIATLGAFLILLSIVPWPKGPKPPRRNKWRTHL